VSPTGRASSPKPLCIKEFGRESADLGLGVGTKGINPRGRWGLAPGICTHPKPGIPKKRGAVRLVIKNHDFSEKGRALGYPDFDKSAAQKHLRPSDSHTYGSFGIHLGSDSCEQAGILVTRDTRLDRGLA